MALPVYLYAITRLMMSKNNNNNDIEAERGMFVLIGILCTIAVSVLFCLYLKNKDQTFYVIGATYIDPNTNKNININESPKEIRYCLNEEKSTELVNYYFKHPDYHVFQPRKMSISQSIFYLC